MFGARLELDGCWKERKCENVSLLGFESVLNLTAVMNVFSYVYHKFSVVPFDIYNDITYNNC